jgi:hypothetical protein
MILRTRAISLTSRLSLVLAVILYAYHGAHGAVEFLNLEFVRYSYRPPGLVPTWDAGQSIGAGLWPRRRFRKLSCV